MNALRKFALDDFQGRVFRHCPLQYQIITVDSIPGLGNDLVQNAATLEEIERIANTNVPFLLVKVFHHRSRGQPIFHSSQMDCQRLQEIFHIDPCGLGMVATNMAGFHCLQGDAPSRPASYYMKCATFKLIWSYDQGSHFARAIAFYRTSDPKRQTFQSFTTTMESNLDLVLHSLFLPLSGATQTVTDIDSKLREYSLVFKTIEGFTASRIDSEAEMEPHELSEMSRQISALIVKIEKIIHKTRQWILAMDSLMKFQLNQGSRPIQGLTIESNENNCVSVLGGIQLIQSKLEVMEIEFNYILARAKNLHIAITQKMTRDNAVASTKLARATSLDSSSMKSVAIMTMAFLPATFFAALFALPSLDWNAKPVVQDNFWVYWAFTLPCTALVFVLWAFLTQRKELGYLYTWIRRQISAPKVDEQVAATVRTLDEIFTPVPSIVSGFFPEDDVLKESTSRNPPTRRI
ncbi:hypothetical protein BKA56DRAFT_273689 [Ilyonectria sp. MPI-CAGE-AT-0026]|nr:hypothetical protein BKA56DRAFT_273689 [Ilyonectria sp. MPI-CAGE-AT-0026]